MRVRFWGTRGTRPTPGRRTLRYGGNTTCVEVRDSTNTLVILDSGSGIAELGQALMAERPPWIHLLVSHTHWDHIQGFPFFAPAFVAGTRITLVGPAGSIKSLKGAFADQMDPAYFPLRLDQVPAEIEFIEVTAGMPFQIGELTVTPHEMNHPIVTLGYRLQENGQSFVFATDNELVGEPPDALVEWCGGATLLAHDAQYSRQEYPSRVGWGHSTFDDTLTLAERAGVRQVAFVHHDPAHTDDDIDALVEEALGNHAHTAGSRMVAFPAAEDREVDL